MKSKILLAPSLLLAASVNAQENSSAPDFEFIIQGVHARDSQTALPITVLSEEEIRSQAGVNIGDSLAMQPGINNASFGPAVGQPVIRGQQGRRVFNLTNGMGNADASGNSADHATTVEPMLATGVEILRGPSTLLYGGGAIGGIVNVTDNRFSQSALDQPVFSFEGRHDSASDMDTVVGSFSIPMGNFVWHADITDRQWNDLEIPGLAIHPDYLEEDHEDEDHDDDDHDDEHHEEKVENTDGFIANSGGETQAATVALSYVLDNGFVGFSLNRITNEYGLPPGVHGHHHEEEHEDDDHDEEEHGEENILIDMERERYDFIASLNNLTPFIESLDYRLSYTDYEHAEMEGPGMVGTRFDNDSFQQRLQLTYPEIGGWHGVFGFQHSDETFGAVGEESFIPETDISTLGVFLVEAVHTDQFTYEVGFRVNRDELDPTIGNLDRSFSTFSYSGSALWDANEAATFGLAYSHSERAPSQEELFSNNALVAIDDCVIHFATGSCEIGDVNLDEEVSDNLEASLYLSLLDLDANITFFINKFDDYIFQSNTGAEVDEFPVRQYLNSDADFYGMELDMLYSMSNDWSLRVFADKVTGKLVDDSYVPRMPPLRMGSELSYNRSALSASLSVLKAMAQNDPGFDEIRTDSYTRWNAEINYTFDNIFNGEMLVFSKLRNITDEEIRLSTSFLRGFAPETGRSIELGVRYSF